MGKEIRLRWYQIYSGNNYLIYANNIYANNICFDSFLTFSTGSLEKVCRVVSSTCKILFFAVYSKRLGVFFSEHFNFCPDFD